VIELQSNKTASFDRRKDEPMISVRNLRKSFGDREVLRGISFDVWSGETLGIIGPSGCGKSTILKHLCGLLEPDSGEVILRSEEIGLVFQGSALLNSMNVRDNLALALRRRKLPRPEEDKIILEKLKLVGLGDFMYASPPQLSGGQQKRTSFARAIVNDPQIILYDEPTTGLDPVMSTIIEDYMIELEGRLHAASIVVTHQLSTWLRTADRILLMHGGVIVWEGIPEEAMQSNNDFIKQFAHATREGPMLTGAP
jgi:phospholipid/cholesterol/gamma-HCH transport system ATP-binding protein